MYLKNKLYLLLLVPLFTGGCATFRSGFLGLAAPGDRQEYVRARDLYNQQKYQDAVAQLTAYIYKAGNVNRREARAYRLLGMSYEQLGQLDKALEVYLEALEFHPKKVPLLVAAANLYQRAGLTDRSQELYARALQEEPENLLALAGQAENYRSFGFYSKARAYYDKVFELDPTAPAQYRARYASTFLNQRNYEQAFIHITMALTEDSTNPDYWLLSAKAAFGLGEYDHARHALDTALLLAPDRKDIQLFRLIGLYQNSRYTAALQAARTFLQQYPQDPLGLLVQALCEWKLGQPKTARLHLARAAQVAPANSFVSQVAQKLAAEWK